MLSHINWKIVTDISKECKASGNSWYIAWVKMIGVMSQWE
jgi:hypothetical protein